MTCPYKNGTFGHGQDKRRMPYEYKGRDEVTCLQAEGHQDFQQTTRSQDRGTGQIVLQKPQKEPTLRSPDLGLLGFRDVRK